MVRVGVLCCVLLTLSMAFALGALWMRVEVLEYRLDHSSLMELNERLDKVLEQLESAPTVSVREGSAISGGIHF